MKNRIYTSVAIVLTLALLFVLKEFVSDYFFDAFFCVVACFAAFEMSRLLSKIGFYNFQWASTFFPLILLAGNLLGVYACTKTGDLFWILYTILIDIALVVLATLILFVFGLCRHKKVANEMSVRDVHNISRVKFSFKKALHTSIAFIYPAFLFLMFVILNHFDSLPLEKLVSIDGSVSTFILLISILIPMFSDTFAMLTGSLIGGKKLCPRVSPGKTISGAVGGVLFCMLLCTCVYYLFGCSAEYQALLSAFPIWAFLIVVMLGSIVSVCGDLVESIVKRRAKVSDSGKILPGHGGMMDRIDSYIFIAPYILLALWIVML